jgi:hypothetical protein
VKQEYELRPLRDEDAGGARGKGAGFWDEEFLGRMLLQDKNRDGALNKAEVHGLVLPHFEHFDGDENGLLSRVELKEVLNWLNHHHQPGVPRADSASVEQ